MTQQYYPKLNDHVYRGPTFRPIINRDVVNKHMCTNYEQNRIYNNKIYNATKIVHDVNTLRRQKRTGLITDVELTDIEKEADVTEHFGASNTNDFAVILFLSLAVCYFATST
jgi:hypothetical protein